MRIFADESRTQPNQGSYMVIGSITCDQQTAKNIRNAIRELNSSLSKVSEFHFNDINSGSVANYKALCDIFFDFYSHKCGYKRGLSTIKEYRCICFDAILISHSKTDHERFSGGDRQLGFLRFYYTLLAYVTKKHYFSENKFHIIIDKINLKSKKLTDVRKRLSEDFLNQGFIDPIKNLQPQASKAEALLQMADVILGAVSFAWNKSPTEHNPRIDAQREVVEYIEEKLGYSFLNQTIPGRSFNIWELDML
jgi:uncharacterized protein (DUF2164 family)